MSVTTTPTAPPAQDDRAGRNRRDRPGLPPTPPTHHPGPGRGSHHLRGKGAADLRGVPRRTAARQVRRLRSPLLDAAREGYGFPRDKWLGDFNFDANTHINPATTHTLATHRVNELVEAADDKTLARTTARYGRVDLIMIDELGCIALDRRRAELLFQVLTELEEKNSDAIASKESFSGWTKTSTDPRLCAAIVDRLSFGGNIIGTGTDSYCLAHTRQQLQPNLTRSLA